METLTVEVYQFDELDDVAQARALEQIGSVELIRCNRYRFFENGIAFDALGIIIEKE